MSAKQVAICRGCHQERPATPGELCPRCNKSRSYSYTTIEVPDAPPAAAVPVAMPQKTGVRVKIAALRKKVFGGKPAPKPDEPKQPTPQQQMPGFAGPFAGPSAGQWPQQAMAGQPFMAQPMRSMPWFKLGPVEMFRRDMIWIGLVAIVGLIAANIIRPDLFDWMNFTSVSGGETGVRSAQWRLTGYFDVSYYNLIIASIPKLGALLSFVTIAMFLTQGSAIADALSNLTGADFTGALGHLFVLAAFIMPTTVLSVMVVVIGCWAMSRFGDARRATQHWIFLGISITAITWLIGDNYLLLDPRGLTGIIRTGIHWLYTAGSAQAFWPVHGAIAIFTVNAFRPSQDGSSLASLHFLLAWTTLVTGTVPFTNLTGVHQYWSLQSVNWYFLYWSGNLIIALGLYVKELAKFSPDGRKWSGAIYRPAGNLVIYAVTAGVAWLLFTYPKWSVFPSVLIGYTVPALLLGTMHFLMVLSGGEQGRQTTVAMYNKIFGDHTVAGIVCLVNDNFNLMMVALATAVLAFPWVAIALRIVTP